MTMHRLLSLFLDKLVESIRLRPRIQAIQLPTKTKLMIKNDGYLKCKIFFALITFLLFSPSLAMAELNGDFIEFNGNWLL